VAGLAGGWRLEVDRDGDVGERGDRIADGIGEEFRTRWDVGVGIAGEGERAITGGIDGWR